MIRITERGDTIVEVLLAILSIGAVLTGAYLTANQSLNTNRASQERGEALKLIEGQIEQVKANVGSVSTYTTHPYFCLNGGNIYGLNTNPPAAAANDPWTEYPVPQCVVGNPARYHLAVTQSGTNTYTILARWERVNGGANQEIKMLYRVAP